MAIDFPASPSTNDTHTHNGLTWTFDGTTWKINTTIQSGTTTFTGLTDTPSSYTGQGGNFVKVNSTPDGLEFGTGGGANVTTSDTPPASPSDGDLWWDSQNGRLNVYYEDANSSQWVDASGRGVNSGVTDGDKGDITVSNAGTNSENWAIDNNTIGTDELSASGTTDATTYLRGDNTWQTISSGPSFSTSNWSLPL
tara:strand:+ start:3491 stop:4078 length:588 start_codon:yes stop_codon:yes gene_type:complete